jgi:hypothetical protein
MVQMNCSLQYDPIKENVKKKKKKKKSTVLHFEVSRYYVIRKNKTLVVFGIKLLKEMVCPKKSQNRSKIGTDRRVCASGHPHHGHKFIQIIIILNQHGN